MAKKLEMIFLNAAGRKTTLSVYNARDNITAPEVQDVMDAVIEGGIFNSSGGDLIGVSGARLIATEVTELAVE